MSECEFRVENRRNKSTKSIFRFPVIRYMGVKQKNLYSFIIFQDETWRPERKLKLKQQKILKCLDYA